MRILETSGTAFTVHTYNHDPANTSYGEEAALVLDIDNTRVFKTLIAQLQDKRYVCAVVPVSSQLDLKALAKAAGGKSATMATVPDAERITGYIRGGISPIGQKKRLPMFIDASAQQFSTIYISGGQRGLDIELAPTDLRNLVDATFAHIAK